MKKNKWYTISVFIIICVLLNLAGKCIAGYFRLPLWLDSLGTVAATYVCGPVCGVIVGVTLNILYSIIYSWTYACYAIVSVSIAVVAGICISKDYMKTLLGALTSSFYIALVSCSISVIFNYMFFNGYTNNIWGSLVYKGRKVALYGGAYAPSYLPNDVDTFTCGVNCGNHQIHHPPLIVKVHFFPCVQIAGNFFDLFRADGIHT